MKLKLSRERAGGDPRVARAGERAEGLMAAGRCCAEAMVLAVEEVGISTPSAVAATVAGLCGGMGNRRATCGVYTGGALALGVAMEGAGSKALKGAAARFQERLAEESGALACDELLERMGPENDDRRHCRRLAARGAEIVAEMVLEG